MGFRRKREGIAFGELVLLLPSQQNNGKRSAPRRYSRVFENQGLSKQGAAEGAHAEDDDAAGVSLAYRGRSSRRPKRRSPLPCPGIDASSTQPIFSRRSPEPAPPGLFVDAAKRPRTIAEILDELGEEGA